MPALNLRIFISSPGDVGQERVISGRVVDRLQGEFAGYAHLDPILWEHEPLRATEHFQSQIMTPSSTDIMVCILWSRLGTRLPPDQFHRADGTQYASGTEWEFEDAALSYLRQGKPDLLVYRKTSDPLINSSDERAIERLEQKHALDAFINRWFGNPQEGFKAAFTSFETAGEFEELLEKHLRKLIKERLPERLTNEGEEGIGITWYKGTPYRGLESFDYEHAAVFFGRTRAIGAVKEALIRQAADGCAFVLVFGMSGGGKSSLVRAGVLPTITQPGVIEGVGLWRWCVFRPSDAAGDLFEGLASALYSPTALPAPSEGEPGADEMAEMLRRNSGEAVEEIRRGLARAAALVAAEEQLTHIPDTRLALALDQMEELFTRSQVDAATREAFVATLAALARSGLVWIIGTMRSDFYPRCGEIPELVALKDGAGSYDLQPPTSAEIGQMIRYPSRAAGLRFERDSNTGENLDDVLLDDASRDPGALPLLEFALDELFRQRTDDRVLTFGAYRSLGGLEGALAQRAEEVFQSLPGSAQGALPGVLRSLVTVGGGEQIAASRRLPVASVSSTPARKALVDAFVGARLLVTDRADNGEAVVRVAHEALLNRWPRLQHWLTEDRDFLRVRARVAGAAAHWRQEGNRSDYLLAPGKPLTEAEDILTRRREDLEADVIAFIEASHQKATRTHKVRSAGVVAVAAAFFVTISGFSVYSYGQARQARTEAANARQQATFARQQSQLAQQQRSAAEEQKRQAETQRTFAQQQKLKAEAAGSLAQQQERAAETQRRIAQQQRQAAEAARTVAVRQTDVARQQRQEAEAERSQAQFQRGRAEVQRAQADVERALAERRQTVAVAVADTMVTELAEGIKPIAGTQSTTVKRILNSAARVYTTLLKEGETPQALAGKARMLNAFVDVYIRLNDTRSAAASAREAGAIFERLVQQEPSNLQYQNGLAESHELIAKVLHRQGRFTQAATEHQKSLGIMQKLTALQPHNPAWQAVVAKVEYNFSNTLSELGEAAEAQHLADSAYAIREQLATDHPDNLQWRQDFAMMQDNAGEIQTSRNDYTGAETLLQAALANFQHLAKTDPDNTELQLNTAYIYGDLGIVAKGEGEAAKAVHYLTLVDKLAERYAALDPHDSNWLSTLLMCKKEIADISLGAQKPVQDFREQLALIKDIYPRLERLVTEDPENSLALHQLLIMQGQEANAYARLAQLGEAPQQNYKAANQICQEQIELGQKLALLDPLSPRWIRSSEIGYITLSNLLAAQGRDWESVLYNTKFLEIETRISRNFLMRHPGDLQAQVNLASDFTTIAGNYSLIASEKVAPKENLQRAIQFQRQAQDTYAALLSEDPGSISRAADLAHCEYYFGFYLAQAAEVGIAPAQSRAAALQSYEAAKDLYDGLVVRQPDKTEWWDTLHGIHTSLLSVLNAQGNKTAGQREWDEAQRVNERLEQLAGQQIKILLARGSSPRNISRSMGAMHDLESKSFIPLLRERLPNSGTIYLTEPTSWHSLDMVKTSIDLADQLSKSPSAENLKEAQQALAFAYARLQFAAKKGKLTPQQAKDQLPLQQLLVETYGKLPKPGM